MNRWYILFTVLQITVLFSVYGQDLVTINSNKNLFRDGDQLVKRVIPYVNPKSAGQQTWDFDSGHKDADKHIVSYSIHGDTIMCLENNARYYYHIAGDSLVVIGHENRLGNLDYVIPHYTLRYPFCYGDSIAGIFSGTGIYGERRHINVWGKSYTVADGYGCMTNGLDTLRNVLRLHLHYEIASSLTYKPLGLNAFSADSIAQAMHEQGTIAEEHYLWFIPGWRYPVMETLESYQMLGNESIPQAKETYLYLPSWQEIELPFDPVNELVRSSDNDDSNDNRSGVSPFPIKMNASLSNNGRGLQLQYEQTCDGTLQVIVCDAFARPIGSAAFVHEPGTYSQSVTFTNQLMGTVVILYMNINGQQESMKINLNTK